VETPHVQVGDSSSREPQLPRAATIRESAELRERAALAREAAGWATARYADLVIESAHHLSASKSILERTRAAREATQESISRYALALKALGTPPERTLRLVKEVVNESIPALRETADAHPLIEEAVHWCIESYYRSTPAA
jgi:hypothetical protein